MQIVPAGQAAELGGGDFRIRRVRPGVGDDPAFGPLALFDHATLKPGKVVRMHEHRNDEILSYMWRGVMVHEDSEGSRVPVSPTKLMMMNAGKSFWHEEAAREDTEMLQIFVRPREADLAGLVNFFDRPEGAPVGRWAQVAGPEGDGAPLTFRNAVRLYDVRLPEGEAIEAPAIEGQAPFLYVIDGAVEIGGERLGTGDGVRGDEGGLPPVKATAEASLVLFLVDRTAKSSRAGSISGR